MLKKTFARNQTETNELHKQEKGKREVEIPIAVFVI